MSRRLALSAVSLAALMLGASASALEPSASLSDIKLGEHWYGPEYSSEDLKGRVVLFEIWGFN